MSIVKAVMNLPKDNPMQWVTFDDETNRMIDCPLPIESFDRSLIRALYFRIGENGQLYVMGSDKEREIAYPTKSVEILEEGK